MEKNFVKETKSELKKVIWPNRQQVVSGTGVVIAMVVVVGIVIFLFDTLSTFAVQKALSFNSPISQNIVDEYDHDHDHSDDENVIDNTDVTPDNTEGNGNEVPVENNGSEE